MSNYMFKRPAVAPASELGLAAGAGGQVPVLEWQRIELATDGFAPARLLGEGGSSQVYRGEDPETGAPWAVKLLRKFGAGEGAAALLAGRAFEREIEVLATIRHPSVVPLLGLSQAGGRRCLVYELMAHGSLAQCLAEGSSIVLSPGQRVRLLAGVAGGLIAMHCNRPPLYHRDVKSANVGVTHGRVSSPAPQFPCPSIPNAQRACLCVWMCVWGCAGVC